MISWLRWVHGMLAISRKGIVTLRLLHPLFSIAWARHGFQSETFSQFSGNFTASLTYIELTGVVDDNDLVALAPHDAVDISFPHRPCRSRVSSFDFTLAQSHDWAWPLRTASVQSPNRFDVSIDGLPLS